MFVAAWRPLCVWFCCRLWLGWPSMLTGLFGGCEWSLGYRLVGTRRKPIHGGSAAPSMAPHGPDKPVAQGPDRWRGADGKSRSEKQKRKASGMKMGRGKKSRAPAARLQTCGSCRSWRGSNPPKTNRFQRIAQPQSRAAGAPLSIIPHPLSLALALALAPPTALRDLSASWGYRRIGTVGGMDAAYEPPWMDSRRVPIRR